jgi:hypothetical protein
MATRGIASLALTSLLVHPDRSGVHVSMGHWWTLMKRELLVVDCLLYARPCRRQINHGPQAIWRLCSRLAHLTLLSITVVWISGVIIVSDPDYALPGGD